MVPGTNKVLFLMYMVLFAPKYHCIFGNTVVYGGKYSVVWGKFSVILEGEKHFYLGQIQLYGGHSVVSSQ